MAHVAIQSEKQIKAGGVHLSALFFSLLCLSLLVNIGGDWQVRRQPRLQGRRRAGAEAAGQEPRPATSGRGGGGWGTDDGSRWWLVAGEEPRPAAGGRGGSCRRRVRNRWRQSVGAKAGAGGEQGAEDGSGDSCERRAGTEASSGGGRARSGRRRAAGGGRGKQLFLSLSLTLSGTVERVDSRPAAARPRQRPWSRRCDAPANPGR